MRLLRYPGVLAAVACASVLSAQQTRHTVRPGFVGVVTDSATGAPVAHATIGVPPTPGLTWTDSAGRFRFWGPREGVAQVLVRCPVSRALAGKQMLSRTFDLDPSGDSVVTLPIDMARCVDEPEGRREVVLSGIATFGFETSMLEPCEDIPDAENSAYGNRRPLWITEADSVRYAPGVKWPKPARGDDYPRVFARYRGMLRGPGSYGHLGVGAYELTVHEVLEARKPRRNECTAATTP